MSTRYQASEARINFGAIISRVSMSGEEVVIERLGQPIVRILPYTKNNSIADLRRRINNYRTQKSTADSAKIVREERDRK